MLVLIVGVRIVGGYGSKELTGGVIVVGLGWW